MSSIHQEVGVEPICAGPGAAIVMHKGNYMFRPVGFIFVGKCSQHRYEHQIKMPTLPIS